jgi:SAM-dependent methyltransferase
MDLAEARAELDERHPWEQARMAAVERIVTKTYGAAPKNILDYGCGDLFTGRMLLDRLGADSLVGVDTALTPELRARYGAGDSRIELHLSSDALGERQFDLVLLLDVIEHTEDDVAVLAEVRDRLAPGGRIVITVPAFQILFSEQDRVLKHFRRYRLLHLHATLRRAGLVHIASGYLFGSLLFVRALEKLAELAFGVGDRPRGIGDWRGPRWLTAFIVFYFKLEHAVLFALVRIGLKLPGLTAWAICKKEA